MLANGHRLATRFGGAEGEETVAEYDETGAKVYEGGWSDGKRSGAGSLFLPSGGRVDGSFAEGELTGTATEFNAAGAMVYRGAFCGLERQGRGTLFENGEAVYGAIWGTFSWQRQADRGPERRLCGSFSEGMRWRRGASFQTKTAVFVQWKNGVRHGLRGEYREATRICGML